MILRVASAGPGHRFQAVGQARRQDLGDGKLIYFSSLQLCLAIRNSLLGCGLQPYSEWMFYLWALPSSLFHGRYDEELPLCKLFSMPNWLFLQIYSNILSHSSHQPRIGLHETRQSVTIYRFHLVPISYRGRRHPEAALGVSEKGTAAAAAGGGTVMAAPL
uniref:Uncharacterized protein n=1 Tax=Oryza barthii TaxID=65489 RepID=A0A0D3GVV8_9ORYZ